MNSKNTGGPAFPGVDYLAQNGMTLRDYFAAKAMQNLITYEMEGLFDGTEKDQVLVAKAAYLIADAMIQVRES